jgi:hypothetical protein
MPHRRRQGMLDFEGCVGQTGVMSDDLAVIILNYRRPQNIGRIVAAAREALPDAPILVYDQGERDDFLQRDDIPWSEVWVQHARVNGGSGARLMLASRLPFDFYIAIDDDTFLTPRQIRRLADLVRGEPDRAHGVYGQRLELSEGKIGWRNGIVRIDGAVSILNLAYAFSKRQAVAAIELAVRHGFASWIDIGSLDDVMLSCASAKPPLCHDLGDVAQCPTSAQPGVAQWVGAGFRERRVAAAGKLLAAQSIAVFTPMTVRDAKVGSS